MLIPIVSVGHWLALYWPSADNRMNLSSGFSQDHRSLIIHHTYATATKTGNSDQGASRNFHIDLETGSVKSITSEEAEMLVRGSTLRVSRRGSAPESADGDDRNALWRYSITDFRKRDYQVLLPGGPSYPVIVNDSYIVAANSQKLIALKFEEKNPIPIELAVASSDGNVFAIPNGKQFQFLDGLKPSPTVYLFELRDDEIHKKGSWPRSQYRGMYRMKDQEVVMLIRPDGKIETRDVLTDELIPIAIDSSIDLSVMEWGLDSKTNTVWVKSGTQKMHFEFGTWRRIPNAGLDTYWLHARSHGRSIFTSPDMQTMVCLDDTSGERIWERKELFPEFKLGLSMSTLGEDRILVYSLTEFGFLILDRETGATIAKHQPLWGIGYLFFAWVAFTSLWWISWFARSVADCGWAWLDCSCFPGAEHDCFCWANSIVGRADVRDSDRVSYLPGALRCRCGVDVSVDRVWENALDTQDFATDCLGCVCLRGFDDGLWFANVGCWGNRHYAFDPFSVDANGGLGDAIHGCSIGGAKQG